MKKIFFAFFAATSLLWTACSNDPIDVSVTHYHDLDISITTDGMYKQLAIKESFQDQILGNNSDEWIRVVTLVYDANGNLVDKECSDTHTFELIRQSFSHLAEGTYTVVTVEGNYTSNKTSEDETRNWTFYGWDIQGEDQLSTLVLNNNGYITYWFEAMGVSCQNIQLNKDSSITVAPKAVGSKIHVLFYNLDKTDCDFAAICTKNKPTGLHLDPSLPSSAKYVYSHYTSSNIWTERGEVRNTGGSLDQKVGFTVYIMEADRLNWCVTATTIGEDGSIKFTAYPDNGSSFFNFEDGGIYYAGLYFDGNQYNAFIGNENEYNTWFNQQSYNEPTPPTPPTPDALYHTPYIKWGGTVNAVKNYMQAYTIYADIQQLQNGDYLLGYIDGDIEMDYVFTSSTGNLIDSYVFIPFESQSTLTKAAEQLVSEGYEFDSYDEEDNSLLYFKDDTGVFVYITSNNYLAINYFSLSYYRASAVKSQVPNKKRLAPRR